MEERRSYNINETICLEHSGRLSSGNWVVNCSHTCCGTLVQSQGQEKAKVLPEEQAVQFHNTVAKLLFVCIRARQNIQTAIGFQTTKTKAPDEDDWAKL